MQMNISEIPTYETLDKQFTEWCQKTFGDSFSFRLYQKEVAINVILSFFNGTKYYISECPTGFGKSFMAFSIAGVLSTYYNKRGYILCSDLSLTKQYSNDIKRYLPEWGDLMGQQNYMCALNGYIFKLGACKLQGINSYNEIEARFPECSKECEYIVERKKAIEAPVTVCTYQQWLIQQNYVKQRMGEYCSPFDERDFVICDEAHNVIDIVQNQFAPRFTKDDQDRIFNVIDQAYFISNPVRLKSTIQEIRKQIYSENDVNVIFTLLDKYCAELKIIDDEADSIRKTIGRKSAAGKTLSKEERSLIYNCDFVKDHYSKFCDYYAIIAKTGPNYIVKNDSSKDDSIIFNCIQESYLMNKVFHSHVKNGLFMSATIGNPGEFAKELNIIPNEYSYAVVPSTFNFDKSPIYYISTYKMNYLNKETSFPHILKMVEEILDKYPDKQGIIQTGNYEIANKIYDHISSKYKSRIMKYDNSAQKQEVVDDFKRGKSNKVLIGPTLIEGIDLKDDICRFQIIFKIPYPNMADKFVNAKRNFNQDWYLNKTIISILQGVGRAIRNENDYAETYILDGCFGQLLNKRDMFNYDFWKRLIYKTSI